MKRHSNSYKTWPKTSFLQNHYFTTEQFARRAKTLVVASWHLLARRGKHSLWRVDIYSLGEYDYSPLRAMTDNSTNRHQFSPKNPNFDNPNPKIDRKHYLLLFYNLNINSWNYLYFQQSNWIQNLTSIISKIQQRQQD